MTSAPLVPEIWDQWVARHPYGTVLQTSRWGALKSAFDWDSQLVTLGSAEQPTGGALLLTRRWALSQVTTLAYVPRGPVVEWSAAALVRELVPAMERAARRKRALALWLEPELPDDPANRALLASLGYRPAARTIQPRQTIVVDLAGDEEALLAQMKQKTRYNIRLAARKGVTVREGGPEELPAFYRLMVETGQRDGFAIHSEAYYRRALELFQPVGQAALLLADVAGETVAALMVFAWGAKAWYFYGASSERCREWMPTYALQWEAMRWARRRGCTTYDLWGIPDAGEETLEAEFATRNDGLWGVYRFKRGFGGRVVRFVGLWEKSLSPLYPLALRLMRLVRRRASGA
ncbi:MAG TPA: peptidoglycan bridge formation glycyltransferase FemA/FemB family protein [Anaerolineae bacterium]|nr:peptidoglycan bridge formation glycyltransferase FemA/FemB family protein [Anaerolineae bacterium]